MAYIETEQKLLNILINDKEAVSQFKGINKAKNLFDSKHQIIVEGILWAFDKDSLLTRNGYLEFLRNVKVIPNKEEVISELICHDAVNMQVTSSKEYTFLIESIKNNWLEKKTSESIVKFKGNKTKFGNKKALSYLKTELAELEGFSEENKNEFIQFNDDIKAVDRVKDKRENPSKLIKTHIAELDWAMPRGLAPGHFTIFCGDVGSGKCVWENEVLPMSDGSYRKCKEIFESFKKGEKIKLISMKDNLKIYNQEILNIFKNGKKEVFELKTHSGFSCKVTGNHPIYTTNGYIRLDKLKDGDYVAINRKGIFGKEEVSMDEAYWLGFMISDGGTRSAYRFTNIDKKIIKTMKTSCLNLGGGFSKVFCI